MQVIGFHFTKISGQREISFQSGGVSTDLKFINLEKEKNELLKDSEIAKVFFKFSVNYINSLKNNKKFNKESKKENLSDELENNISFEGNIILSASKDESKNLHNDWKKKKISQSIQIPLYNLILKKCSIKAAQLADEINLPPHLPIPQLKPKKSED